jgi:hypothetical protein
MFDGGSDLRLDDDAALVAAIAQWDRAEATAAARRLEAIAELTRRRTADGERTRWSCDNWDGAAAEVAAAMGISHGRASRQMDLAVALRDRLPRVGALFMDGRLSARLVSVIADRTYLIQDIGSLACVDLAVAHRATAWGALSVYKLEQAIDMCIDRYDPGALRRTRERARSREVVIGARDDQTGIASIWGRLYGTDAALLDRRLMQMAHSVCDDDPRTVAQRRADALGALAAGADRLACGCNNPDCPAAGADPRAASVVVHVIAEDSAVNQQPDAVKAPAALIAGRGVLPTPLLAELIHHGATIEPLTQPGDRTEPGYRPSTALQRFIRLRDLTCRFPGCDQPAEFCDIDREYEGASLPAAV